MQRSRGSLGLWAPMRIPFHVGEACIFAMGIMPIIAGTAEEHGNFAILGQLAKALLFDDILGCRIERVIDDFLVKLCAKDGLWAMIG